MWREAAKPALGLMPQWLWRENRIEAIFEAFARRNPGAMPGLALERQWAQELLEQITWLADRQEDHAKKQMEGRLVHATGGAAQQ